MGQMFGCAIPRASHVLLGILTLLLFKRRVPRNLALAIESQPASRVDATPQGGVVLRYADTTGPCCERAEQLGRLALVSQKSTDPEPRGSVSASAEGGPK